LARFLLGGASPDQTVTSNLDMLHELLPLLEDQ
jgi:hypothetical protein